MATINNILEINHKTKSKELEIIQGQEKISNPETNFVINKL
jgi:pyridoxal/pyridoxine/pyridoxamine kinase